jgi:2-polyprenyl-3-methyl-5-hydroxy-6-metoxy-1,4-benzoquinol methylase
MTEETVHSKQYWNNKWKKSPSIAVNLDDYQSNQVKDLLLFGRQFITSLGLQDMIVLDIGGGTGKTSRFFGLQDNRNKLHLVDISSQAVDLANGAGICAQEVNIEASSLPFEAGVFDLVLCMEVIEHLMKPEFVISEAYRVLKPGGLLFISTPNLTALGDRILLFLGQRPLAMDWDPTHIRFYRFKDLQRLLESLGFSILHAESQGVYLPFRFPKRWKYIRIPFIHKFWRNLGQHITMLAFKPRP